MFSLEKLIWLTHLVEIQVNLFYLKFWMDDKMKLMKGKIIRLHDFIELVKKITPEPSFTPK